MLFLEMCERGRRAPSRRLAAGRTEKFQGCVAETLLTVATIIETIHTNMGAFGIHSLRNHLTEKTKKFISSFGSRLHELLSRGSKRDLYRRVEKHKAMEHIIRFEEVRDAA
jgi:hypothetical protein